MSNLRDRRIFDSAFMRPFGQASAPSRGTQWFVFVLSFTLSGTMRLQVTPSAQEQRVFPGSHAGAWEPISITKQILSLEPPYCGGVAIFFENIRLLVVEQLPQETYRDLSSSHGISHINHHKEQTLKVFETFRVWTATKNHSHRPEEILYYKTLRSHKALPQG